MPPAPHPALKAEVGDGAVPRDPADRTPISELGEPQVPAGIERDVVGAAPGAGERDFRDRLSARGAGTAGEHGAAAARKPKRMILAVTVLMSASVVRACDCSMGSSFLPALGQEPPSGDPDVSFDRDSVFLRFGFKRPGG